MSIINENTVKKYNTNYILILLSTYLLNCKPNVNKSPISKLFNISPDIVKVTTGRTLLLQYAEFMYAATNNTENADYTIKRHIILTLDFIYHTFPKEEWPEQVYKLTLDTCPNVNAFKLSTLDYNYIFAVLFTATKKRNYGTFFRKGINYSFTKTKVSFNNETHSMKDFILHIL